MRSILIDWLVEVAEEYKLMQETLYTTVHMLDYGLAYRLALHLPFVPKLFHNYYSPFAF